MKGEQMPRVPESELPPGRHDIFEDPALSQTVTEDPLFKFLAKHWQQVLLVIAAVAAGIYAYNVFQASHRADLERGSDLLAKVRQEMTALEGLRSAEAAVTKDLSQTTDEKAKPDLEKRQGEARKNLEDAERRLAGLLSALEESRAPYGQLGKLYRGLSLIQAGKSSEGLAIINQIQLSKDSLQANQPEAFYADLISIVRARAELDMPESRLAARQKLSQIAQSTSYFNVAAALTLARSSNSDAERAEGHTILLELRGKFPEQAELLDPEIERLAS